MGFKKELDRWIEGEPHHNKFEDWLDIAYSYIDIDDYDLMDRLEWFESDTESAVAWILYLKDYDPKRGSEIIIRFFRTKFGKV